MRAPPLTTHLAAFMVVVFSIVVAGSAKGQSSGDDDGVEWFSNGSVVEITGYDGTGGAVTIPGTILVNGKSVPVTSIGPNAFSSSSSLTSVIIPDSVTSIGGHAFSECSSLTSVTIGNGVTSIGANSFYYCVKLASLTIPGSVTSIGNEAFDGCFSLSRLTILYGVTNIGVNAFNGCTNLTSVTIPGSVTSLGQQAFCACYNLAKVCFEGNAPTDGGYVFYYDSFLSVIYHVTGTTGWGPKYDGIPTASCTECSGVTLSRALQVTITPSAAASSGAQWRVDGGALHNSGATLSHLSVGNHAVSFKPIAGWTTPADQVVLIGANTTATATGTYADIAAPTLTITSPKSGSHFSSSVFTATGTAKDNAAVAGVYYQLNGAGWALTSTGNAWTNWSASNLNLVVGTNTFSAYSVDTSTNYSKTNTVKFEYVVTEPLTVQIVGKGTLAPNDNGKLLTINNNYTMTAVPAAGFAFGYWSGGVPMSASRTLTFTMSTNLTIIANFEDVKRPVNVITFPTANKKWTNSVITVTGKASDNVGVSKVWVQINTNDWAEAETTNGFKRWSATNLTVIPGTNLVQAFAVDAAGNVSLTNSIKFIAILPSTTTPAGMTLIPAGSFTMGDTLDGLSDAIPTNVYVSAFYMDVNLVSSNQWQAVYSYATNHGYSFVNYPFPGTARAANYPVESVDWFDAVKWSNARSQQAGLKPAYYTDAGFKQVFTNEQGGITIYLNLTNNGYRLPTEAEWEKAARGGLVGQRFPWGNSITESQANYFAMLGYSYDLGPYAGYNTNFDGGILWTDQLTFSGDNTSPVGFFAPNGYGLCDMAGNVSEWCWDWYATPYGQPTTNNPTGPAGPLTYRVQRGGNWNNSASMARCANRFYDYSNDSIVGVGFRCARGL